MRQIPAESLTVGMSILFWDTPTVVGRIENRPDGTRVAYPYFSNLGRVLAPGSLVTVIETETD